ncbi:hypothetical protein [Eubacterium pyruvativorans]|nr:hypothetical protein [Eubacterium pyruvativorans]
MIQDEEPALAGGRVRYLEKSGFRILFLMVRPENGGDTIQAGAEIEKT